MTNLQLIEALCTLVEYQAGLIRSLAATMEEERCITQEQRKALEKSEAEYSRILGAGELG